MQQQGQYYALYGDIAQIFLSYFDAKPVIKMFSSQQTDIADSRTCYKMRILVAKQSQEASSIRTINSLFKSNVTINEQVYVQV